MSDVRYSFYQAPQPTPAAIDSQLPRLLEKVLDKGYTAYVCCHSEERAERLSEALWGYDPTSFLPHGLSGEGHDEHQPVLIGHTLEAPKNKATVMVIISGAHADYPDKTPAGIERVVDIFESSEKQKQAARERWKHLLAKGVQPEYFAHEQGGWHKRG